jgi:hypothetical protein
MGKTVATWQMNEVDRMLNDPTAVLEPHRVWSLLAEIAETAPQPVLKPERAVLRRSSGPADRRAAA